MKKIRKLFKRKIVLKGAVVVGVLFFLVFLHQSVKSNHFPNVSGYAWGSDDWSDLNGNYVQDPGETMTALGGLGFVSFNCASGGNCASVDYGVNIDASNNMIGYAWSPHFGWLKFGGLSGFPIGPGTLSENAKITNGIVTGWARFCAGADTPGTCLGGTGEGTDKGSWDGWVSLKGTGYGVTLDSEGVFDGYAWGGNHDVYGHNSTGTGWIDFKTDLSGVIYDPLGDPAVLLDADPQIVELGSTTTLSWTGEGLVAGQVCTATEGIAGDGWATTPPTQNRISPSGTFVTNALNELGTHPYTITCPVEGPGGNTVSSTVNVTVGIDLRLEADPTTAPWPDYETDLHWFVLPSDSQFASCTASASVSGTGWGGSVPLPPFTAYNIDVPANPTTFNLSCTTLSGTVVNALPVSVPRGPIPQADIIFTNSNVLPNGSGGFVTNLTWSTINIVPDSCEAWAEAPTVTGWDVPIAKADFGTQNGVIVPNIYIDPNLHTYRITCDRLGGGTVSKDLELHTQSGASRNPRPHYKEI